MYLVNDDTGETVGGLIQSIAIIQTNKTFLDKNNVTGVSFTCIAPVWDSDEWVNRTFNRKILSMQRTILQTYLMQRNT